jgi:diphthamide biosynthesis protein 7
MDKNAIVSTLSVTLDLPPSCIQFCPAHPDYFVVGTYHLEQGQRTKEDGISKQDEDEKSGNDRKPQSRNGSLLVFQINGERL